MLLPATGNTASVTLPQTGQTVTHSAGDDGDNRSGKVWPLPRFGNNQDGTILDKLSGLVWSSDANLIASQKPTMVATTNGEVNWQSALDYVTRLNKDNYLGYRDWRIPNLNELTSVLHQGKPVLIDWLGQQGINNVHYFPYWTSSSVAINPAQAWVIDFTTGSLMPKSKPLVAYVWPVRGDIEVNDNMPTLPKTGQSACFDSMGKKISCVGTGQDGESQQGISWPAPRFTHNNDATITDNLTGIVWLNNANLPALQAQSSGFSSDGKGLWSDALKFVARLNQDAYLGHADWRLPNRNEMVSLINFAESDPANWLSMQGFTNTQQQYWSSGTSAATVATAWNISLTGEVSERNKYDPSNGSFVWPIRGGSTLTGQGKDFMHATTTKSLPLAVIAAPLTITTTTLVDGYLTTPYSQTLTATGGTSAYTWSVTTGTLPTGLSLAASTRIISGTPTTTGASGITVQVKDPTSATTTKALTIIVYTLPSIVTTSLSVGTVGTFYSQSVVATGGKSACTWSVRSGQLPAGLTLAAATGMISGTPTTVGTSAITFMVADANNKTTARAYSLVIVAPLIITTTTLADGYLTTPYSQTLTATGGKSAYTWSVTTGNLPTGLSQSASTRIISGTPAATGASSITVQVKDATSATTTKALTIIVHTLPSIVTTSLSVGTVGTVYSQSVVVTGGKSAYTWSVRSGQLPAGLTLAVATGMISGTPTTVGTSAITLMVTDANNKTTSRTYSLVIVAPLTITTTTLADGYLTTPYSRTLTASGGKSAYTWSVITGNLPAGLTLAASTGIISGTPTTTGVGSITVQVKDATSATTTTALTIIVYTLPSIVTTSLSASPVGTVYSQSFVVTGGKSAYIWSVRSGQLPAGLALAAVTGIISGTPTTVGASAITLMVADANNKTTTRTYSIVIAAASLTITTSTLSDGYLTTPYSQTLTASSGKSAYTWSITTGVLPTGLSLVASTGIISGTPTATGVGNFTVQVKDATNTIVTKAVTISVYTPLTILTAKLPFGSVGLAYTQILTASGGKLPYVWSSDYLPSFGFCLDSSSGIISGIPTTQAMIFLNIQVQDANNVAATKSFALIANSPPIISTVSLPDGAVGTAYNQTVTLSGGIPPYNWSVSSGVLPVGFSLDSSTGVINGTPTTFGMSNFTVQALDTSGYAASKMLTITIDAPLMITTTLVEGGMIGTAYGQTLTAMGGKSPYTWSVIGGSIPGGLSLDSTGIIGGTPTFVGNSSFTLQAKDANNVTASKPLTMTITSAGAVSGVVSDKITGDPLPGVTVTLAITDITYGDPTNLIYACNDIPLIATDYTTVTHNDSAKYSCLSGGASNAMTFKVRNPYGAESFTSHWNGMLTIYYENLAQSFKPKSSGKLTNVEFYLPRGITGAYYAQMIGELHVQLKTGLGGDAGGQLAESSSITIESLPIDSPQWVEFVFPIPAYVTAGQDYYLEIQGRTQRGSPDGSTWWQYQPEAVSWGNSVASADSGAYRRRIGLWEPLGYSMAFRTSLDNKPDNVVTPLDNGESTALYGVIGQYVVMSLLNRSTGKWETGGNVLNNPEYLTHDIAMGGYSYRGDDLTIDWTIGDGYDRYYDANSWLTVLINSYGAYWDATPLYTSLLTDQFKLSFNRTFSAKTDSNGAYFFPKLPDGSYTLTFEKSAYVTTTTQGALTSGRSITLDASMTKAALATVQGTIRINGAPLAGIKVTVTSLSGSRSAFSDGNGSYLVDGIAEGNYSALFEGSYVLTKAITGFLLPGQVAILDTWLTGSPVTVTIAAPLDGAIIAVTPLFVNGNVTNADSVTVNVVNNGIMTGFPATIINGTYAVSIPLQAGQTKIYVNASNRYHLYSEQSVTATSAPFTLHNRGDIGAITVMEATGNYDAKNPDGSINDQPRQALTGEYIRSHDDTTNFLVMLSTFDYAMPETGDKGFYTAVKNDTEGINRSLLNNSFLYGSQGTLQGTIDLGNINTLAAAPHGPKLEELTTTLSHELMHRFGAYVRFKNPDGTLNSGLLGKDNSHWSYLLGSKGSLMYGNGWRDNGNGTFTSIAAKSDFSPLDLYLMGMIPKEQVPPLLLIDNPVIDKTLLPQLGATISGTAMTVTIDAIIAAEGARVPDASGSQKQFNAGFVLLTRPGDDVTAALQAIELLRKVWAGRFAELTSGKGSIANVTASLEITVDSPVEGATIIGPDVLVSGTVINTRGVETGITVNGMSAIVTGNRFVVNHVPLQVGGNVINVNAIDVNGLATTTKRNATAQTGNYIRFTTSSESGVGPLEISLELKGSFSIAKATITASGPSPLTLVQGANPAEFSATLTMDGTYVITATALGPDGKTYQDTVAITVLNRTHIETLLKEKWEGMRTKISANDVNGALGYMASSLQNRYREFFTALGTRLPLLNDYLKDIELIYLSDGYAKCRFYRDEMIGGQVHNIEYVVYFVQENGIWRLWRM